MKTMYRVVEENVDGCGGEITAFVEFSRSLSIKEGFAFQSALQQAKKNRDEGDDTGTVVKNALKIFGLKDGQLCSSPYEATFVF